MKRTLSPMIPVVLLLALSLSGYAEIQVLDSRYTAHVYVAYPGVPAGGSRIVSDSDNNLYLAHTNAQVNKITSDRTVLMNWATGFNMPWSIEDASGTKYGNQLYVTEGNYGLSKLSFDGTRTPFITNDSLTGLTIDRYGNYGGDMFVGTSDDDRIYRVSTSGLKTTFCTYFSGLPGGIASLAVDRSGRYGGLLFAAAWSATDSRAGLYSVNAQGQAVRFCSDLAWGGTIMFDRPGGLFGGDMFITSMLNVGDPLQIYRVSPSGVATPFIYSTGGIVSLAFGADGAMYFHELHDGVSNIIRVVPEPATILLLTGGVWTGLKKRKKGSGR